MLNEIKNNNTVEEVDTSNNFGDDTSDIETPTEMNKKIKDYLQIKDVPQWVMTCPL